MAAGIIRLHIDVVRAPGGAACKIRPSLLSGRCRGSRYATQGGDPHAIAAERASPPFGAAELGQRWCRCL